jgi:hypothetical protein
MMDTDTPFSYAATEISLACSSDGASHPLQLGVENTPGPRWRGNSDEASAEAQEMDGLNCIAWTGMLDVIK